MVEEANTPWHIGNLPDTQADFVTQAAKTTGFSVYVDKATWSSFQLDYIGVWTREPRRRDHGPFWKEFERLRDKTRTLTAAAGAGGPVPEGERT